MLLQNSLCNCYSSICEAPVRFSLAQLIDLYVGIRFEPSLKLQLLYHKSSTYQPFDV